MAEATSDKSEILARERAAYDRMREELERHHDRKFVVLVGDELKGTFDAFDSAAQFAQDNFGRGPYLIRQVGSPTTIPLPASVAFNIQHASR